MNSQMLARLSKAKTSSPCFNLIPFISPTTHGTRAEKKKIPYPGEPKRVFVFIFILPFWNGETELVPPISSFRIGL